MSTTRSYSDIREISRANAAAGQHWFEASTMRFFNSRVLPKVYGGRYFVSSECREPHAYRDMRGEIQPPTPRCYSVRVATADGAIRTVGAFNVLSIEQAKLAAAILGGEIEAGR